MQYKSLKVNNTFIEFHNSWLGEETVIANGQLVSRKSSIMGTHHPFTIQENGKPTRYVLTTKIDGALQVFIDLRRNGEMVFEDVLVPYRFKPKRPANTEKKVGVRKLREYDIEEAVEHLKKGLDIEPDDPEIYFHLACAYSILEKPEEGFTALQMAVAKGLSDTDAILSHDMLAFLRMQEAFPDFLARDFREFDARKLAS